MNCSFVFYSKSSDKAPDKYNGKGWSERKNIVKKYDWRKKLSNMYTLFT
jgi:hypothetical protein